MLETRVEEVLGGGQPSALEVEDSIWNNTRLVHTVTTQESQAPGAGDGLQHGPACHMFTPLKGDEDPCPHTLAFAMLSFNSHLYCVPPSFGPRKLSSVPL